MRTTPIFSFLCASMLAVTSFSAAATENLADRHVKLGFKCETCHAGQQTPSEPSMDVCTGCHKVDALVEKTKNVKPTNPHVSPHYGNTLECINCHMMHGESTNFCDQCHQFNFKMP